MTAHPDILELELLRTGEADPTAAGRLQAHLDACPECQAELRDLASLEAGFAAGVPEIEVPASVDLAVAGAIEDALERTEDARIESEVTGVGQVLRPSVWRRVMPILGGTSAAAAALLMVVSFFGDNVRSLFGASADALAGSESRTVSPDDYASSRAGYKSLSDFSENTSAGIEYGEAAAEAVAVAGAPVGGESAARRMELSWAPRSAFSGTLVIEIELPEGARILSLSSARAGDRVTREPGPEPGRITLQLTREEASNDLVSLQLSLEGGGEERLRLLQTRLQRSDGRAEDVPLQLRQR